MVPSRLELALALASAPLSLDQLVDWGLARPAEAWGFLRDAQREGWLAEAASAGPGHFEIKDEGRRAAILEGALPEDLRAVAARPELASAALATARKLAAAGAFRRAAETYRALLSSGREQDLPGGAREWLAAVLELARIYPEMYGVGIETLDRALGFAEAIGDVGAQCVLLAARGLNTIFAGRHEEARELFERATESARSQPDPVRTKVHLSIAAGFVRQGRLSEAIATFEDLLGDVPQELVQHAAELIEPGAAAPAAAIGNVAYAYTHAGQYARALEILHRVLGYGQRTQRENLVFEMQMYIALMHMVWGDPVAALEPAQAALDHYARTRSEPMYLWYVAGILAWVRATEGDLVEARRLLKLAQDARIEAGAPPLMGPITFRIEELLGLEAFEGTGLDLIAEAHRVLEVQNPYTSGMARRLLARHKLRETASPARDAEIGAMLDRAVSDLRESGAAIELARALADGAAHADRCGRPDDARRLRDEEARVRARLPRRSGEDIAARSARLAQAILDLGRLSAATERAPAMWGEMTARLCEAFGAERAALVECGPPPRLLAARGGDADWAKQVLELAERPCAGPEFLENPECCLGVRIPFAAQGLQRSGYAVLENQHTPSLLAPGDEGLLHSLATQLGVLLGNVVLWQELARARDRLEQENRYYREKSASVKAGSGLIAHSAAMGQVLDYVQRVATTTTTVLVLGETGVGKELVAKEVHRRSQRAGGPFIAVHIASLSPGLVASGLFGHERGAFTGATAQQKGRFELADGGTLFLDEIGELSPEDQVRLLRVLQEGSFERVGGLRPIRSDFRLVAATNRSLEAEVKSGRFREDLFFRLNVFPIRVPPLRERREEIPTLALYFMERFARNLGRSFEGISEADMERLASNAWPGNVRELEHLIERAVLLSDGPRLRIPPLDGAPAPAAVPAAALSSELATLEEVERQHIARVLRHTRGRITGDGGAAQILGLKASTLNWTIGKLGLKDLLAQVRGKPALAES